MGEQNAVALASIGLAASAVAGVIWVVKYLAKTLSKDLTEHTKAAIESKNASLDQARASRESANASKEMLTFMKSLNGKLAKATIQTVQEQNVEHQTVKHQDKE